MAVVDQMWLLQTFIYDEGMISHRRLEIYHKDTFLCTNCFVFKTNNRLMQVQKYCRMLQWMHSAILSTFIKLPIVIKIFVLSIFKLSFYTCFTIYLSIGILMRAVAKLASCHPPKVKANELFHKYCYS